MQHLWGRMRERRLVQWVLAYLAGAWLLLQVVHLLGEQFDLPLGMLRSFTAMLAVGVLAALVLAWYHGEQGRQRVTGPELVMLAGILVIASSSVAMVRNGGTAGSDALPVAESSARPDLQSFPAARDRSVAVLPFANMSEERENEHFSDGLTEELMMDLARMTNLRVISRTSVMRFKASDRGVREIGDELGVAYVVTGSVRRDRDRVRIFAQLIDARTDQHVWANSYDSDLHDIFEIQRNIAAQIATSLRATLPTLVAGGAEQARPTQNLQSYQLYLEGKFLFHDRFGDSTAERLVRSAELLQQAVQLDPQYARAWAALALTHAHLAGVRSAALTSTESASRAQAAVAQAVSIDPSAADAYVARGMLHARRMRWADAERSFLRALEAEPQNAAAHEWYGTLLVSVGRSREAERILRRSAELDPMNARTLHWLADALRHSGRMEESRLQAQHSVDLGMNVSSIGVYLYHLHRQEWDEAVRYQEAASRQAGHGTEHVRPLVEAVRDPARIPAALAAAQTVVAAHPRLSGIMYAFFFDLATPEPAFDAMDELIEAGDGLYSLWRMWEPQLTHFRNHPRFLRIAHRLGLLEYWREWGWPDLCHAEGAAFTCR